MRLFISYAHVDKPIVDEWIVRKLRAAHHEVWIDESLSAGKKWKPQLKEAIEASDALVYAMTPESIASKVCRLEVETAIQKKKPIVPVLMQARTHIPAWLGEIQYVDFSSGPTGDAVAKLIGGLQRLSSQVQAARPNSQAQGSDPTIEKIPQQVSDRTMLKFLRDPATALLATVILGVVGILISLALSNASSGSNPSPTSPILTATPATPIVQALRDLEIRSGPGANFSRLNILPAGSELDILGITDDRLWYQVLLSNGTTGWVLAAESGAKMNGNRAVLLVITPTFTPTPMPTNTQEPSVTPFPTLTPSPTLTNTDVPQPTSTASATTTETLTNTALPEPTSTTAPTQVVILATTEAFTPTETTLPSVDACANEFNIPMVLIPETTFFMGLTDDQAGPSDERPGHPVTVSAFCMDVYEVTNARYTNCINDGACTPPQRKDSTLFKGYFSSPSFARFPVINLTWDQAQAYCAYRGGRLPTEAEWEIAARYDPESGTMRTYPWGTQSPNASRANYKGRGIGDVMEVGQHPDGASPYGVYDLSGNVAEWVLDWYGPYNRQERLNPVGPQTGSQRVVRGGSFASDAEGIRGGVRAKQSPGIENPEVGFRCVLPSD